MADEPIYRRPKDDTSPPEDVPIAQKKVGRFEFKIGKTLGQGSFGIVKLGTHLHNGSEVALKFLMPREADESKEHPEYVKQFNRERKVLETLSTHHRNKGSKYPPNVIRLFAYNADALYPDDDGTETKCALMVLDFMCCGTLFDFVHYAGHFVNDAVTRSYLRQMVSGLNAVHKLGYAHCDIKPENLLLDRDFTLKIADFGCSEELFDENGKRKQAAFAGSPGYQAPEMLRLRQRLRVQENVYADRCDIFALGVVLFIIAVGHPPFEEAWPTDVWWSTLTKGAWHQDIARRLAAAAVGGKEHHNAAASDEYEKFWANHGTPKIDDTLKNLLVAMMHPSADRRFTIEHIKKDGWYNDENVKRGAELRSAMVSQWTEHRTIQYESASSEETTDTDDSER